MAQSVKDAVKFVEQGRILSFRADVVTHLPQPTVQAMHHLLPLNCETGNLSQLAYIRTCN